MALARASLSHMTSNRPTRAQLTTPPAMLVGWVEAIIIVVCPLVVLAAAYLAAR